MDAGLPNGTQIKAVGVDELNDQDTEEVLVVQAFGSKHLGQAAEEIAESAGLRLRRVIG